MGMMKRVWEELIDGAIRQAVEYNWSDEDINNAIGNILSEEDIEYVKEQARREREQYDSRNNTR